MGKLSKTFRDVDFDPPFDLDRDFTEMATGAEHKIR